MAKKFIIQGDRLRISANVEFHLELIQKFEQRDIKFDVKPEQKQIKGGGWWHTCDECKFILFYSSSTDFGPVNAEDLKAACPNTIFSIIWDGYSVYYSDRVKLQDALENKSLIHKIES